MTADQDALYYPFHLCSENVLMEILRQFRTVHFRDYMAFQLTPFLGTTAFQDRMGDTFPELVAEGRIRQGHPTSGPLDRDMHRAVDQDLADPVWRRVFHHSLREYRRFQRGLFDPSHGIAIGGTMVPGPAALLELMAPARSALVFTVDSIRKLSANQTALSPIQDRYDFEYGLALIKTALSNLWTVRIACHHDLSVATESRGHYDLLQRTLVRGNIHLVNRLLATGSSSPT